MVREREQPGAKARALRHITLLGVHHAQPGVLEHLVGLRSAVAAEQAPHKTVQRGMVALVQPLESLHVAGREGRHQRHIVIVGVHRSRCRVVVHRMESAMWRRPYSSRTSVERTSGDGGVTRLSANASAGPAYDRRVVSEACRMQAARLLAAWACVALLTACGGGIYLGFELGDPGDQQPSVALTASATEAPAGATVRLAAAASDDFGVHAVSLYREDAQGAVLLG